MSIIFNIKDFTRKLLVKRDQTQTDVRAEHLVLGQAGEELALDFLVACGLKIVTTNVSLPVGFNRTGAVINAEIDIVAYDRNVLCFLEVKTRRSEWFAPPEANVDLRKQRQITRAASAYRRMLAIADDEFRFDVVSVILPEDPGGRPSITHHKAFWTESKFRKRRWANDLNS
jgi:putative endonuclease